MTVTELRQALAGMDPHATVIIASGGGVLSSVVTPEPGMVALVASPLGSAPAPGWKGEHGPGHPDAG